MRKMEIYNTDLFSAEITEILQILSDKKIPAEINTKGLKKYAAPYPSVEIIEKMREYNIPILLSDDAHHADDLGYKFAEIDTLLKELKYDNYWKLDGK